MDNALQLMRWTKVGVRLVTFPCEAYQQNRSCLVLDASVDYLAFVARSSVCPPCGVCNLGFRPVFL